MRARRRPKFLTHALWRESNKHAKVAQIVGQLAHPVSAKAAEVLDAARETAARVAALRTSDRKSYLSQAAQALEEFKAQQSKLRELATGAGPRAKQTLGDGEGAGAVTIAAVRTGGSAGAVSVTYATSSGTATAGADYACASATLSWADGEEGLKTFTVTIANDAGWEESETFGVSLQSPAGGAALGTPASAVVTIADDDPAGPGTLRWSSLSPWVDEGSGTKTITVLREGGSLGSVSVSYASGAGTATSDADYTPVSGTLSWVDGDTAAKTFDVPILDDSLPELYENAGRRSPESRRPGRPPPSLGQPASRSPRATRRPRGRPADGAPLAARAPRGGRAGRRGGPRRGRAEHRLAVERDMSRHRRYIRHSRPVTARKLSLSQSMAYWRVDGNTFGR